jgi:hypothetical protein
MCRSRWRSRDEDRHAPTLSILSPARRRDVNAAWTVRARPPFTRIRAPPGFLTERRRWRASLGPTLSYRLLQHERRAGMTREPAILVRAGTQLPPCACRLGRFPVTGRRRAAFQERRSAISTRASRPRAKERANALPLLEPSRASPVARSCETKGWRTLRGHGFAEDLLPKTPREGRRLPSGRDAFRRERFARAGRDSPDVRTRPLFTPRPTRKSRLHCK